MKLKVVLSFIFFCLNLHAEEQPATTPDASKAGTPSTANAEKQKIRKEMSTNTAMSINYGSAKWNTDPKKIDSASIVFRDAKTNKTALIIVDETAPDSATFDGKYIIRWGDDENIIPEIYIPPQEMVKKPNWLKEFNEKINSGKLKRKPFLSRKTEKGQRVFEVFDTKEQAEVASKAREEARKLDKERKGIKSNPQMDKVLSKTAAAAILQAEKLAALEAEKLKLAAEEAAREAERVRLAQIEKQREEERKRKQAELDAAERARRQKEAARIATTAMEYYIKGNFVTAEDLFRKSVDLDPNEKSYYYYYGIALFRNDKNNDSIVILQQAEGSKDVDLTERDYYVGLNYYKLKELKNGLEIFRKIKASNHKTLGPSGAFYEGLMLYEDMRYEEAKDPFQEVLDNQNSDPKLDAQAETYLEHIAAKLRFAAERAKRILTSASLALQYDSNVLYTSNNQLDQGTASDVGGIRSMLLASAQFRPIYEEDKEFSSKLATTYMYSANSAHAKADPLMLTLTFPYTAKGTLVDLASTWDLIPGIEVLYMDADADGTRENLINSGTLSIGNTLVLSPDRMSTITAAMRQDESPTTPDSTAFRLTLGSTQLKFLNKERDRIATGDVSYMVNNARGNDYYFSRIDLKGSYTAPWNWGSTLIYQLGYYLADYSKMAIPRTDNNYSLSVIMSRNVAETVQGALTANYTIQNSSAESFTFNKWSLMYMVTSNWDF